MKRSTMLRLALVLAIVASIVACSAHRSALPPLASGSQDAPMARRTPKPKPTKTPTTSPSPTPTESPSPTPTESPSTPPTEPPSTPPTEPPTPPPTEPPTPPPTEPPTPPSPRPLWISGDPVLGAYRDASSGQCGSPLVIGTLFSFSLSYDGGQCVRNQMQPLENGRLQTLIEGETYTFMFHYVDGDVNGNAPGMGLDCGVNPGWCPAGYELGDSRSLLWQIHAQPDTSVCTYLGFSNGPNGVSTPQYWLLTDCGPNAGRQAYRWTGLYTQGEAIDWTIEVKIATEATGFVRLYKNGTLVFEDAAVKTVNRPTSGSLPPWWNFGPYKWTWANNPTYSAMTSINATFTYFAAYYGIVPPNRTGLFH